MEKYKLLFEEVKNYCYFKKDVQELHDSLSNARFLLEDSDIAYELNEVDILPYDVENVENQVFELLERA